MAGAVVADATLGLVSSAIAREVRVAAAQPSSVGAAALQHAVSVRRALLAPIRTHPRAHRGALRNSPHSARRAPATRRLLAEFAQRGTAAARNY